MPWRFVPGDQFTAQLKNNGLLIVVVPADRRIAADSQTKPIAFALTGKR